MNSGDFILHSKIGDIVARDYRVAEVFEKHEIDYSCCGNKTLEEACEEKHIAAGALMNDLGKVLQKNMLPSQNMRYWSTAFLCEYIVNTHHAYVRSAIRLILESLNEVIADYSVSQPAIIEIAKLFRQLATEMQLHMIKEENVLFPYIKQLNLTFSMQQIPPHPSFGQLKNSIEALNSEHNHLHTILTSIRQLSDNYSIPQKVGMNYRVLFVKLNEFDMDFRMHAHIENNILFPLALENESYYTERKH